MARAGFFTTRWSLVRRSGDRTPAGRRALEELCARYWAPIYAAARRRGASEDDAQDLTQGFFVELLEREALAAADEDRGRFRTFLLTCFRNYAAREFEKGSAKKRGGGRRPLSLDGARLDFDSEESRYLAGVVSEETPEVIFDRRWALAILDGVLKSLAADYERVGRSDLFNATSELLARDVEDGELKQIAEEVGMTHGAMKVAVHRLRDRYRQKIRDEIAETVSDPSQIEEELDALRNALTPR